MDPDLKAHLDEMEGRLAARLDEMEVRLAARLDAVERSLMTQMDAHEEELMKRFDATGKAVASLAAAMASRLAVAASNATLLTRLENNLKS